MEQRGTLLFIWKPLARELAALQKTDEWIDKWVRIHRAKVEARASWYDISHDLKQTQRFFFSFFLQGCVCAFFLSGPSSFTLF